MDRKCCDGHISIKTHFDSAWPTCDGAKTDLTLLRAPRPDGSPEIGAGAAFVLQARRTRKPQMKKPFFFFGSLRDPDILSAVLGRDLAGLTVKPARLPDHKIERAAGYSFPMLTPKPGANALGSLTWGLTPEDEARIAYFEDSEYACTTIDVACDGGLVAAQVYVASAKLASSGENWDLAQFQAQDRPLLLAVTRYVMTEHYGVTPQGVMEQIWHSIRDRIAREMDAASRLERGGAEP
jgi:hypothetical protein